MIHYPYWLACPYFLRMDKLVDLIKGYGDSTLRTTTVIGPLYI